jgi:uncharacterized protein (TIGR01370 family)
MLRRALVLLLLLLATAQAVARNVAFYYGPELPVDELRAFDLVVVEPDYVPRADALGEGKTELFAYVSVGEQQRSRSYFAKLDPSWKVGENSAWGSVVIDQSQPAWHAFFVEEVVAPLWARGFRGFFLDTLDSYHLVAKTDEARARQEAGMVALVHALRARFPDVKLIVNRGFEILPAIRGEVMAVAAESLYRRWNQSERAYGEVPSSDREWLLGHLNKVVTEYRLPVIAIDYVPPQDRELARATAARIRAHGFTPYVADPEFLSLGVGNVEAYPRKVLVVYAKRNGQEVNLHTAQHIGSMPLNYLGYAVEFVEVSGPLPEGPLTGRYAGIVSWLSADEARGTAYPRWLKRQLAGGMRLAAFDNFGFEPDEEFLGLMGLEVVPPSGAPVLQIQRRAAMMGFEHEPVLPAAATGGYRLKAATAGESLLRFGNAADYAIDAAAITPAGGYVLSPNSVVDIPQAGLTRWVVQPLEFLRRALALPDMPVPDASTENGLRLMLVHIDGDGFPSRAELPGTPIAGEALLKEVLEKYRVPTTMSVIEAEVSPRGIFKELAPAMQAVARRIFALPHVEVASHSLSHPFFWKKLVDGEIAEKPGQLSLHLPGYQFDLKAEIPGSIEYIERTLAPAGKRGVMMLWTGDCVIPEAALKVAHESGLLNMNGGYTVITRSRNTWTLIAPLGAKKGQWFQVYAPNQNENVYTNEWRGPFYGFERVIETFELTEAPYRFKPINIYYHTYAVTKRASLNSLHKIYQWALRQPVHNIYASEYARKVLDFNRMVIARDWARDGWLIRAKGDLRTVRVAPNAPLPALASSTGMAGFALGPGAQYVHLTGDEAFLRIASPARAQAAQPFLASANGRIVSWQTSAEQRGHSIAATFESHVPLAVEFAQASHCELHANGRRLRPARVDGDRARYELDQSGRQELRLVCS